MLVSFIFMNREISESKELIWNKMKQKAVKNGSLTEQAHVATWRLHVVM